MNYILTVNLEKGQVVRQLFDTTNNVVYIRTATMLPNNPNDSINPPNGFVEKSYIAEHNTTLKLKGNGSVMDNDGNPYASLLQE